MDKRLWKLARDSQANGFRYFAQVSRLGMSDHELESLSKPPHWPQKGLVPWICWESENSSYGLLFREWTGYPKWLPLALVTPHGAFSGSRIWPNEIDGRVNLFFGWPETRVQERKALGFDESYLVEHPWVRYRRKYFKPNPTRNGLVFFYPHANKYIQPRFPEEEDLIAELKVMQEEFGPITLCLSSHDINNGAHKDLRRLGFPIVTAGSQNSTKFAGRFYSIISQFEHSASSDLGSQVFYCIEAGIPHTLTQTSPEYIFRSVDGKPAIDAENDYSHVGDELAQLNLFAESLRVGLSEVTDFQRDFVERSLGVGRGIQAGEARQLLFRSLTQEKFGFQSVFRFRTR